MHGQPCMIFLLTDRMEQVSWNAIGMERSCLPAKAKMQGVKDLTARRETRANAA